MIYPLVKMDISRHLSTFMLRIVRLLLRDHLGNRRAAILPFEQMSLRAATISSVVFRSFC